MQNLNKNETLLSSIYLMLFTVFGLLIPENGFAEYPVMKAYTDLMTAILPMNGWVADLEVHADRNLFFLAVSTPIFIVVSFMYAWDVYKDNVKKGNKESIQTGCFIVFMMAIGGIYIFSNFEPISKYSGWLERSFTSKYLYSLSITFWFSGIYVFLFLPLINWYFEFKIWLKQWK